MLLFSYLHEIIKLIHKFSVPQIVCHCEHLLVKLVSEILLYLERPTSNTMSDINTIYPESKHQDQDLVQQLWELGSSPIKIEALENLLLFYNDRKAAEFMLQGFKTGFCLGYYGPRLPRWCKNFMSAKMYPVDVREKIDKEVNMGRILGPFISPPIFNLITYWDCSKIRWRLAPDNTPLISQWWECQWFYWSRDLFWTVYIFWYCYRNDSNPRNGCIML